MNIDYIKEDEEDAFVEEELEDDHPQAEMNDYLSSSSHALATSLGTFNDLVTISFSQPLPSPRVTLEGLVGFSIIECGINPVDQSSTLVTTNILRTHSILPVVDPLTSKDKHPLGQGGVAI